MAVSTGSSSLEVRYSELDFKPVLQEVESLYVKDFCRTKVSSVERLSEDIINKIGKDSPIKAQVVYLKSNPQQPCGVIVYEDIFEPKRTITIHLLQTTNHDLYAGKGISRHMLYKMITLAKRLPSSTLCAAVNPEDSLSLHFYERNAFRRDVPNDQIKEVMLTKEFKAEAPAPMKRSVAGRSLLEQPTAKASRTDVRTTPTGRKPLEVTLKQQYLSLLKSGKKTVEGRIASGMFSKVFAGTKIRFFNQADSVLCTVTKVTKYASFIEMLQGEGVEKCLPGTFSVEAGARIYDAIPGYRERAEQNGVVALQLQIERS